jgi:Rps23 Pro-64 3,4-dihydroxylase Tpa1-like proline 4-hydroxylase
MTGIGARAGEAKARFADQIVARIAGEAERLRREFRSTPGIRTFVLDDLLDAEDARRLYERFPEPTDMLRQRTFREFKYASAQMNRHHPLLEECVYAFQDPRVVTLLSEITGIAPLEPDPTLYVGGISLMAQGCFVNPHLDNSHDARREKYRVLNALFYVSPGWRPEYGGNLELWDHGVKRPPRTIHSRFNRLVVMEANQTSYHSVSPVVYGGRRCCIANYYFTPRPVAGPDYFHVTSFRGKPGNPLADAVLRADAAVRNALRILFPYGIRRNPHVYRRGED